MGQLVHYLPVGAASKRHQSQSTNKHDKCPWCGHGKHDSKTCPVRNAVCNYGSSKGHVQTVCRKKKRSAHRVQEDDIPHSQSNKLDDLWAPTTVEHVGNVHTVDVRIVSVKVNETRRRFRTDTGTDNAVIPKYIYDETFQQNILHSVLTLRAFGNFKVVIKHCGNTVM